MKISAIIPAYQESNHIKQCLDSLDVDEILVGVDGCEDTLDTLHHIEIPENARVFWMEHSGPYVVRNTLAEIATGDVLLFFDADDWMLDGSVEKIGAALSTGYDLVYYDFVWSWGRDYYDKMRQRDEVCKPFEHYRRPHIGLKSGKPHRENKGSGSFAMRADLFEGFMPWPCGADTEYKRRMQCHRSKFLDDVLFVRRRHTGELTTSGDTRQDDGEWGQRRKEAWAAYKECCKKMRAGDYSYIPDPIVTTDYREIDCD